MATLTEWARRHPKAAAELTQILGGMNTEPALDSNAFNKSEAWAQQQDRVAVAQGGGLAWRNNVGATPARCPDCGEKQRPIRYGLANDSAQLNARVKSSDIIGVRPVLIHQHHVGATIGQFVAIESKRPGWRYKGTDREQAQAAWLALITKVGGFATFSTGSLKL